jgi:hypothetical protein
MANDAGFWYQNLPADPNRAKTGIPEAARQRNRVFAHRRNRRVNLSQDGRECLPPCRVQFWAEKRSWHSSRHRIRAGKHLSKIPNYWMVVESTMRDSENSNSFPTSYFPKLEKRENVSNEVCKGSSRTDPRGSESSEENQ